VDALKPSMEDITALMCGVAADSTWKRGKRNFMIVDRDIIGTKIQVRYKSRLPGSRKPGDPISSISLVTANWRIVLKLGDHITGMGDTTARIRERLAYLRGEGCEAVFLVPAPSWAKPPVTVMGIRNITNKPEFDIHSPQAFERDWTLLKLFSSEWSDGV